jgi:hypothetical protein
MKNFSRRRFAMIIFWLLAIGAVALLIKEARNHA